MPPLPLGARMAVAGQLHLCFSTSGYSWGQIRDPNCLAFSVLL
jgi:hypothetical protein